MRPTTQPAGSPPRPAKHHILANLTPDEEGDYDMDDLDDLAQIIVEEY